MDLIDRQDVIKAADIGVYVPDVGSLSGFQKGWNHAVSTMLQNISSAPSAEKRGRWVHDGNDEWHCSICGNVIFTEGSWEHPLSEQQEQRYCFFCGAKMEE